MKKIILLFIVQICMLQLQAQHFAIGNEKFNIAYIGIDNPVSVAVENCPCSNIVLKVENGTVTGNNCKFIFRGKEVGGAYIIVYKKTANHLKEIGRYGLRVKRLPPPAFKIGPYSSNYFYSERKANTVVLAAQQFVRAESDGFDFDLMCRIDSFSVKIFNADSGNTSTYRNVSNKISQQISNAFSALKSGDTIFFNKIFARGPEGIQWQLDPLILTIEN